ncbi:hypothetical protein CSW47_03250 [Thermus scotoductus]|uniref:Uncharacterized protein n=1 Tax=Thermus scotoductus TaxID=37636 RepID=A0A430RFM2_THESC|nr:hypothetical protein [Thermus scotoductus]RTH06535.1 hypothetical protein CSW47_03250 [Thermus scotoductus]
MKDILQGLKPEKSIGLRTLRALLLEHQAHALPWRGVPVTGFLLKDQVEVSLKRQGLAGWFAPMLEAHKEALERALKEGKTGVFFVSDPEKLVLTPFAFPRKKELLADLGEEPYRFPQEIVSPKAPMVLIPVAKVVVCY